MWITASVLLDKASLVIAGAELIAAPPIWATGDDGLTAQPPAIVPVVIVVWPPTASEEEAVTHEPVVKVVVLMLMIEVVAMIKATVVEMAFARSKVAGSQAIPAANAAGHMATTQPPPI